MLHKSVLKHSIFSWEQLKKYLESAIISSFLSNLIDVFFLCWKINQFLLIFSGSTKLGKKRRLVWCRFIASGQDIGMLFQITSLKSLSICWHNDPQMILIHVINSIRLCGGNSTQYQHLYWIGSILRRLWVIHMKQNIA